MYFISYRFSIMKSQNNSEITNFLSNFLIPDSRIFYIFAFKVDGISYKNLCKTSHM